LEDYNYFINKAVQQYMNLAYNKFDISQQTNDDLRVLTTSKTYDSTTSGEIIDNIVNLPEDYVHLLSCIVSIDDKKISKRNCENCNCSSSSETPNLIAAKRVTSDSYAGILNNYYLRPTAKRPYYMLKSSDKPIPSEDTQTLTSEEETQDSSDRTPNRSNKYHSQLEIKCGNGKVSKIEIDYVRAPQKITLTDDNVIDIIDTTPQLEFPDYVCYEIINIFVKLLMENAGDPRLQTNLAVNTTIPSGA
jgi:hypothetical protein